MWTQSSCIFRLLSAAVRNCRLLNNKQIHCTATTLANNMDKFTLPDRYIGNDSSVWVEYIQLALDHKPLNLGQGFADFAPPSYMSSALASVSNSENVLLHQYTRGFGHPRLVTALSKLYSQLTGKEIDPQKEILVTSGAYEALFVAINGHVNPGDEVIIIDPYFDCYDPMVRSAGGIPRSIPLRLRKSVEPISSADWTLDEKELESLFNKKTKIIILNTPHNPLGKVFSRKELEVIANLCKKWNVLCISDEVYEWLVYQPNTHVRIATLPGMWERTVTIGSAGKTFSVTGWKTGWAYGSASLIRNLQVVHQNCVYTCSTPLQEAIAIGFETELPRLGRDDCYFVTLPKMLEAKRDYMVQFLRDVGMVPTIPEGGFFMIADWSALESKVDLSQETDQYKDYRFTKWMTKNVGLQGIPPSAFYSGPYKHIAENLVRYCFIKTDENLKKAADILKTWNQKTS